jgi:iron complex outermembrane receptor protein
MIGLSGRYQHGSYVDFANEEMIDGYFLLNARASYTIKGMKVSAFVNNLSNSQYFNHAYVDFDGSTKYFVQAPINFYAAIQYSF